MRVTCGARVDVGRGEIGANGDAHLVTCEKKKSLWRKKKKKKWKASRDEKNEEKKIKVVVKE